jgi:hypothetical protein
MNERLFVNSPRKSDARNAGAEQNYATTEQQQHAAACANEPRKCALDTGARGWRYVYHTH